MSEPIRSEIPQNLEQKRATFGWLEVSSGVALVTVGHIFLFLGGLLALCLSQPAAAALLLWQVQDLFHLEQETALIVVRAVLVLLSSLGYLLLLAGLWRCLTHLPAQTTAKDLTFLCLGCWFLAGTLAILSVFLGGGDLRTTLAFLAEQRWLGLTTSSPLLHLGSSLLGLAGFFLFSHILLNLSCWLDEGSTAPGIDPYLVALSALCGAAAGAITTYQRWAGSSVVWIILVAASVVCLGWYCLRVRAVQCQIQTWLNVPAEPANVQKRHLTTRSIPKVLSGVRRTLRALNQ